MTTPHDQAIREAANSLVEYGQTVGAFDRADVAGRAIESILRDLVAKAVADDHKRFADSCRGELVDLRAQLTAAQDEVKRFRAAAERAKGALEALCGLFDHEGNFREGFQDQASIALEKMGHVLTALSAALTRHP